MAKPVHSSELAYDAAARALPYRLELLAADGAVKDVLATTRSASLAYACYYGALREYVGEPLVLRHEANVLATSGPRT